MAKFKIGQEVMYDGKKEVILAVKKDFATRKYSYRLVDGNKEYIKESSALWGQAKQAGAKLEKELDKELVKLEAKNDEKKKSKHNKRKKLLRPYWDKLTEAERGVDYGEMDDVLFANFLAELEIGFPQEAAPKLKRSKKMKKTK